MARSAWTTLNPNSPLQEESSTMGHQLTSNTRSTNNRSFPIRTSQSQRRVAASTNFPYAAPTEYHLRRKTPNGAIESAYDDSLTSPVWGTPPHKQTILHMPNKVTTPSLADQSWLSSPQVRIHGTRKPGPFDRAVQHPPHNEVLMQHGVFQNPLSFRSHYATAVTSSDPFVNSYQPVNQANEYNVRAFCPPPLPPSEALPFAQGSWQPWPSEWDRHHPIQPGFMQLSNRIPNHLQLCNSDMLHYRMEPVNHQSSYMPVEQANPYLNRLAMDSLSHISKPRSDISTLPDAQPRFKERALLKAHGVYIDLLAHLQAPGSSPSGKAFHGFQSSSKTFVYPKPPNPSSLTVAYPEKNRLISSNSVAHGKALHEKHHQADLRATNVEYVTNRAKLGAAVINHASGQYEARIDPSWLHKARLSDSQGSSYAHAYDGQTPGDTHPVDSAKSSLDVITDLCEQGGWKWVDGILVGGCLNYGLENYEAALDWFSRVLTIDANHVVALANSAAALYCLNRQGEAEDYWLKALKLCPSYLEAAEHLVGLLYRKRSSEAIEVINFVQQCLILPPSHDGLSSAASNVQLYHHYPTQTSHALPQLGQSQAAFNVRISQDLAKVRLGDEGDSYQRGFGSSGYAVPGCENGRMLALVHAKGTLLYSQKQIGQASKAFEEAVLISVGRHTDSITHLVHRIQTELAPREKLTAPTCQSAQHFPQPLLLPPEKARQTAQLVFSGHGELPGLRFVTHGPPKRAAIQTTSNSLLSLAKIFQDAMSNGANGSNPQKPSTGVSDILALYYLSLSLQESPSTANNVGILLAGVQQPVSHQGSVQIGSFASSAMPGMTPGSGLALALAYYQYGLRLDPRHVHLHTNLGSLLKDIGQLDLAIQMYEQAVSCDGTFDIALTNLANAVKDRGRINDAITYYRRAVESNPDFAEAVCGLFTALNSVCDWKGRGGVVLGSGKFDRWHVDDDGALLDSRRSPCTSGLAKRVVCIVRKQLEEASQWGRDTLQENIIDLLVGDMSDLCSVTVDSLRQWLRAWKGKPWEGSRLLRLAERALRVRLRRWYHDRYVSGVKSVSHYRRPKLPSSLAMPSAPTVLPFHTFTCPLEPNTIRSISQRNAARISFSTLKSSWVSSTLYPPPPPPEPQLNVGYLSSDFNNHPLAHLMQSVFGFHNPRRARAVCYATTASDKSCYRQKIEREAPVFRDVSSWSPDRLLDQIVRDQIHILVNLNGYTRGARNEIFAARPAPIQMSFMGFAGTLGAEWCDYVLADSTAIPPDTLRPWRENVTLEGVFHDHTETNDGSWMYSENIIFCRDTFFCCDHAQSCDPTERQVTWEQEQARRWKMRRTIFPMLSDDTVILGNFNQLYKIEPTTFWSWLRILARVPKAVLWLLRFPESGESNLRSTAERWAGPEVASRIIFTDVAPKGQHISRARVCDLFLDTPECNAHTTAADVLWSSTPILTYPRYPYKMCSRMAASILKGALPKCGKGRDAASELIVSDEEEYESTAVALAEGLLFEIGEGGYGVGHGRLADLRNILWLSRWECALFDTRRWVDDLERAYEEAWRKWVSGEGGDIYL